MVDTTIQRIGITIQLIGCNRVHLTYTASSSIQAIRVLITSQMRVRTDIQNCIFDGGRQSERRPYSN